MSWWQKCCFLVVEGWLTRFERSPCTPAVNMLLLLLLSRFSRVRLLATPWTAAYQDLPSMGFSRQEYWSVVPLPSPSEHVSCLLIRSDLRGGAKQRMGSRLNNSLVNRASSSVFSCLQVGALLSPLTVTPIIFVLGQQTALIFFRQWLQKCSWIEHYRGENYSHYREKASQVTQW